MSPHEIGYAEFYDSRNQIILAGYKKGQFRIEIDLNLLNDALYTRKGKPDLCGKYYGGDAYIYSKALELCFAKELSERLKG